MGADGTENVGAAYVELLLGNHVESSGTDKTETAAGLVVTRRWVPGQAYYMLDASPDLTPKPPLPGPYDNGNGIGGDDLANFNGGAQLGVTGN